jgi:hypothetical protein
MMRHVNCRPSTPSEGSARMGRAMGLHPLATTSRTTHRSSAA